MTLHFLRIVAAAMLRLYSNQGCQIGHFVDNFKKIAHLLTALAMKKRVWPFCNIFHIWPFFSLSP